MLAAGMALAAGARSAEAAGCNATLFEDGFENQLDGWSTERVYGDWGSWEADHPYPPPPTHSGWYMARFNSGSSYAGTEVRLFRSEGYAVSSGLASLTLHFWMYHDPFMCGTNDTLQVQAYVDGAGWSDAGAPIGRCADTSGWEEHTVDLSSYIGGPELWIGFLGHSAYGRDIWLDDVSLVGERADDEVMISGRVEAYGEGLGGVTVTAGERSAVTASDGSYVIGNVLEGTYEVTPTRSDYWFEPASTTVSATCDDLPDVDFQGHADTEIAVTITADELDAAHGGSDSDSGMSLREAVTEANRDPSRTWWIVLDAATYTLSRHGRGEQANVTGDLDVHAPVVMVGAGMEETVIDADQVDRVLHVDGDGRLTATDLTVTGGELSCSKNGGGIYVKGFAKLLRVRVTANQSGDCTTAELLGQRGGHGGGLYCTSGVLTVIDSEFTYNVTGNGADGMWGSNSICTSPPSAGGNGGDGGSGGGIAEDHCTVSVKGTLFENNEVGDGGDGGPGGSSDAKDWCTTYPGATGGVGGDGGWGGGLWLEWGHVEIDDCSIAANALGHGGNGGNGGTGQGDQPDGDGGDGGHGGRGGGVANHAELVMTDTQIEANGCTRTYCGGGSGGNNADDGWGGIGGGVYNAGGYLYRNLQIERCTVFNNLAWVGGGIYNRFGVFSLMNSTFTGNGSTLRGAALADDPQDGFPATIDFCTFARNEGEGPPLYFDTIATPVVNNTIIADNAGREPIGEGLLPGDHNIVQESDPGLAPLDLNGVPTPTMALLDGSPAIDAADPAITPENADPPTDQRGASRVSGGRADIGAYEVDVPPRLGGASYTTTEGVEGQAVTLTGTVVDGRFDDITVGVRWGDGTSDSYRYHPTTDPFTFSEDHAFGNNPPNTPIFNRHSEVSLSEDGIGMTDAVEVVIAVRNVAPTMVALKDVAAVPEGAEATLYGKVWDSVATEAFTVDVDWADGTAHDTIVMGQGQTEFSATHGYADDGPAGGYDVTVYVTDDDGAVGPVGRTTAVVNNVAPQLSYLELSPNPTSEGGTTTLKGRIEDPGTLDTFRVDIDWGDGSIKTLWLSEGIREFEVPHVYADDDPTGTDEDPVTVSVTVRDDDGGVGDGSVEATVSNVPPVLSVLASTACLEGGTTTLTGTIEDPGADDWFSVDVDWGDGDTESHDYPAGTTTFSLSHQVLDIVPGGAPVASNLIEVTIRDDDTGWTTSRTSVQVTNVAPALANVAFTGFDPGETEFRERQTAHLTGDVVDPGGSRDGYVVDVEWGDGSSDRYELAAGATSFDVTHVYLDDPAGPDDLYTASLTVTDDDTGTGTAQAAVVVRNVRPYAFPETVDADEDAVLHVPAPGVLANDDDTPADTPYVVVADSDAVSMLGAVVTVFEDGSFSYDPTARSCSLQGLAEGESVDDRFNYFVADEDMLPGDRGPMMTTVTVRVTGHDESGALYVDASATGLDDGSSWANAFRELADALAVAWGGQAIHVAAGTYTPDVDLTAVPRTHTDDRAATFLLHRGVAVYGGYPVGGGSFAERSPTSYPTVLSGDLGAVGDPADNTLQIVTVSSPDGETPMSSPTVLDGFRITGAYNDDLQGGGMVVRNASAVVARCTFTNNSAGSGGGLALVGGGAPRVEDCVFEGNTAASASLTGRGGGLFVDGTAAVIAGSVFRGNTAVQYGGGLSLNAAGSGTVSGCTFNANTAAFGGAVSILGADMTLANSVLWGDTCVAVGCTSGEIHDNTSFHSTVSFSDVMGSGGSGSAWWDDSVVNRHIVDGGGNIDGDPLFILAPADLHLQATPLGLSPAIDAGDNALVAADGADRDHDGDTAEPAVADLDGLPRRVDSDAVADTGAGTPPIVDMGAYEVQAAPVLTVTRAGTGSGTVVSVPAGIDCGGSCLTTFPALQTVTLAATPADGSTFVGWVSSQPSTCAGPGSCSLTMPAAGAAWAGALFALTPTVDLSIGKTDGTDTAAPGGAVTYTITVGNAGPSDAVGATVTDVIPAGLAGVTWSCLASAGSTCSAGGSGDIDDTVTILAGGSLTYTVTGMLAPSATQALVNTATVTPPPAMPDADPADNVAVDTDAIGPETDLAVTVDDGTTTSTPGAPLTYTVVVTNGGPSDTVGAQVTDVFPTVLNGVTWTCTPSAGASCAAGPVAGNIEDSVSLPVGGTVTYIATGTLDAAYTGALSNTASVAPASGSHDPDLADNVATDVDGPAPAADLAVTVDDGTADAVPGMSVTYTVVASNPAGPSPISGGSVEDLFPDVLSCSWTCVGAGGGACTAGPVLGDILDSVDLPVGGAVTYTAVCEIPDDASGSLANTATVAVPPADSDPVSSNDTDTDSDTLLGLDFGDAPDSGLGSPWAYPVTLAEDGARHGVAAGLHLGAAITAEQDGAPSAAADGDGGDDGVTFTAPLVTCEDAAVTVTASAPGLLDAWVDFNADGDWDDAGEQVLGSRAVAAGSNDLAFAVPCGAAVTASTFARFRLSSAGGLGPGGVAADGEVEDLEVAVLGLDFGDAADPPYPTLLADDGARHAIAGGLYLGAAVDAETEPVVAGDPDDDGVVFDGELVAGTTATVTVTASAAGMLDAWVDFDADGDWSDVGEQVFAGEALAAGPNTLTFAVPSSALQHGAVWARFRFSSAGGLSYTGFAPDGEVEDHAVKTMGIADLAVTVDDGVAAATPGGTVTYTVTVGNVGPSPAPNAHVTDTFPDVLTCTWTCTAAGGGSCPAAGSGAIDDQVSLPAGAAATYTAVCDVAPSAVGTLANTASVAPEGPADASLGDNAATDSDALVPEADLEITKVGPEVVLVGRDVTYTVQVANLGPSDAAEVVVGDALPAGTSFVSQNQTSGPTFALGNTATGVTDTVAVLPAGAAAGFTIVAHVDGGVAAGTELVNTATVSTAVTDPVGGNDAASVSATVVAVLPPLADKVFEPASVPFLNGVSRLTVTVTNPTDNAEALTGIAFTDTLPPGLLVAQEPGLVSTCTGTAAAVAGSGAVSLADASLDPGSSCTVSVDVEVDTATVAVGDVTNTVTVSSANGGAADQATAVLTLTAVRSFSDDTATGTGTATASFAGGGAGCTFAAAAWVGTDAVPDPPPYGYLFAHGLLTFELSGCTPGSVIDFTLTMPEPLDEAATYLKHGPTAAEPVPHWYDLPAGVDGDTVTFSVTDGGLGDDDLLPDGRLSDAGGPLERDPDVVSIPALGWLGLLAIASLIGFAGVWLLGGGRRGGLV